MIGRNASVHAEWLNAPSAWKSPFNLAWITGDNWAPAAEQTWAMWRGLA